VVVVSVNSFDQLIDQHSSFALRRSLPESRYVDLGEVSGDPVELFCDVGRALFLGRLFLVYRSQNRSSGPGTTSNPPRQRRPSRCGFEVPESLLPEVVSPRFAFGQVLEGAMWHGRRKVCLGTAFGIRSRCPLHVLDGHGQTTTA
jgi:hypothetical protein